MLNAECGGSCAIGRWPMVSSNPAAGHLGSWAATRFREEENDMVMAVNEATYMTVVVALDSDAEFLPDFRAAFAAALQDLGIPSARTAKELGALDGVHLSRLRDARLRSVLNMLQTFCGIEFCYHSDPRTVQRNLNEVPPSVAVCRHGCKGREDDARRRTRGPGALKRMLAGCA